MKNKYRMFRSGKSGYYYWQDNDTGKQGTLGTLDKGEAQRLVNARNESCNTPATAINLQIARAYLNAADPRLITRTWQEVMEALVALKHGTSRLRWDRAIDDRSFDRLRPLPLIETCSDHFLKVLEYGKVPSNVYLRRIHNFALAMDWLLKPVIPKASWPKVTFKTKRAVTAEERRRIIEREKKRSVVPFTSCVGIWVGHRWM